MNHMTTDLLGLFVHRFICRLERMLAGMLTRKPVRLNDTADPIREHLFDVDLQGNDLNVLDL